MLFSRESRSRDHPTIQKDRPSVLHFYGPYLAYPLNAYLTVLQIPYVFRNLILATPDTPILFVQMFRPEDCFPPDTTGTFLKEQVLHRCVSNHR